MNELEYHYIQPLMNQLIWLPMVANITKDKQSNIILSDERIQYHLSTWLEKNLNLIESLDSTNTLEEIHTAEEYIELHNEAVNKITAVGNSTSQTIQFLQQISYKERKRVESSKPICHG